ncbi:hypothetical protein PENTCL1PPCAC_21873, partial [Pristionchus entomophagus]
LNLESLLIERATTMSIEVMRIRKQKRKKESEQYLENTLLSMDIVIDEKTSNNGSDTVVEDTVDDGADPMDYFNILGLPTELISHSISFL